MMPSPALRRAILTLFPYKWQTPSKDVHEVGQPVRMRRAIELSNIHDVVLVLENSSLVVVYVEVIWCRKDRHD
jgi:hypothetical protein